MIEARRLRMGLSTVLGWKPQGFFIPHRHADQVAAIDYPTLEPRFAERDDAFLALLAEIEAMMPSLRAMTGPAPEPRFDQEWFSGLDAAAAYTITRRTAPARIVEVGSGHSTRFLARAIRDGDLATRLACIDPAPRAPLDGLPAQWLPVVLQEAPTTVVADLEAGDILFVDSSHILMPGSDVDWLLNRVLPGLAVGVLVHVHDIFLPDAYPQEWAWRGYNEQCAIASLLQGESYELVFASHYVASRHRERLSQGALAELLLPNSAPVGSLWIRKRGVWRSTGDLEPSPK